MFSRFSQSKHPLIGRGASCMFFEMTGITNSFDNSNFSASKSAKSYLDKQDFPTAWYKPEISSSIILFIAKAKSSTRVGVFLWSINPGTCSLFLSFLRFLLLFSWKFYYLTLMSVFIFFLKTLFEWTFGLINLNPSINPRFDSDSLRLEI